MVQVIVLKTKSDHIFLSVQTLFLYFLPVPTVSDSIQHISKASKLYSIKTSLKNLILSSDW